MDLSGIRVDRVLDVATGEGGFTQFLADHLGNFGEIVGIDVIPSSDAPESVLPRERIRFVEMDAEALSFEDESFDVAGVSLGLHHFPDPLKVLGEMRRVLRPSGYFIIRETHRDVESEPERTDMILHHWVAKIDRLLDSYHAVTYSRDEILVLIERLRLSDVRVYDARNNDSDPFDSDALKSTEQTIARYLQAAAGLPDLPKLQEGARELRHRLRDVGIQWEPEVFVIGRKP
ncbi:MAG: methyltransferase domain-containing protein [Candidatus Bipolaricaulia bacterium]